MEEILTEDNLTREEFEEYLNSIKDTEEFKRIDKIIGFSNFTLGILVMVIKHF